MRSGGFVGLAHQVRPGDRMWLPGDFSTFRPSGSLNRKHTPQVNHESSPDIQSGRSALFGYAVLRANFDHRAPSYRDNFSAFVVDALFEGQPKPMGQARIADAIRETFGLTIPDGVVGQLLRKLVRTGKVLAVGDAYQLSESAQAGLGSLRESMAKFQVSQMELLNKFTLFVKEHHSESVGLIDNDPGYYLQAFIERYAAPLLRRGVTGDTGPASSLGELQGTDYLVGSFVRHLEANDAAAFSYLIDAVKGAILLGVLQAGPGDVHRKLTDLTLVLDTPVLLSALGFQGDIPQRAVEQTLTLAHQLGVRLVCFEHTVKEIDGVLEATIAQLRSGRPVDGVRQSVYLHFLTSGESASDLAISRAALNRNLQSLGVRPVPVPDSYYKYGLDENALETLMKELLPGQRDSTRLYDLQSLSAVHRLRKGSSPGSFELCRFVFVTDNWGLTAVGRRVDERHNWPLAMLDSEIASLLWVRSPAVADDLPRQQLVAAVYTAMQPPPYLWLKYVEEIERLERRGGVNADEAVILRSLPEAREALMDVTLGETNNINPGSMERIVERVKESLSVPYKIEAADARAERDLAAKDADSARREGESLNASVGDLTDRLEAFESADRARERRIKERAQRKARAVRLLCVCLVALILVAVAVIAFVDSSVTRHLPSGLRIAFGLAAAVLVALTAVQLFFPGSVADWFLPAERRLARSIERRMRLNAGLLAEASVEPGLGAGGAGNVRTADDPNT